MQRGDFTAAIAGYKLAFERTPWNTRLGRSLVAAYAARAANPAGSGRTALRAAEADLRAALQIAPDDPALRRSLTAVLLDLSAHEEDRDRATALREEARRFDPDLETQTPIVQLAVERRLDMAFDLLERGQLDAGINRLERLYADYPDRVDVMRLLAQAQIRKGTELVALRNYRDAGLHFDQAVDLYGRLAPCDGARCQESELRMAHRNRVVAWLSASGFVESQRAMEDAEAAGLSFPALRAELRRLGEKGQ
jgi:tetratricopeptide (TPR) repeat protein